MSETERKWTDLEDKEIIDLFYVRSEQAIGELALKYGRLVRRVANNILGDAQSAEECENDTYLACWNSIPPEYPQQLVSYVCRIARNKAVSIHRAMSAQKRNSLYDVSLEELRDCLGIADSLEDELQTKELGEAINRFLGGLKAEDRLMFMRRYWFSDPVSEIAKRLKTSENRVSVRLFRTREKLRRFLKKEGLLQ